MNKEQFIVFLIQNGFKQHDDNGFIFKKEAIEIVLYMNHYAIKKYKAEDDYILNSYPTFPFDNEMFVSDMKRI